ncbi:hypothetical protein [Falsiroseomonas sp.]|uniref:hypothetical protein n=1 Tax=Falsiroseomonas sp. TaxID=2870721 RepID=UPI003569D080
MAALIPTPKLRDLLGQADPTGAMNARLVSSTRIGIAAGLEAPKIFIDLPTETLVRATTGEEQAQYVTLTETAPTEAPRSARRSGHFTVRVLDKQATETSLKSALQKILRLIEEVRPGTLQKLAASKGRTKRIVARNRQDLFKDPKLAAKFATPLMDGWWVGTNNSTKEVENWVRLACNHAGLEWQREVSLAVRPL